MKNYQDLSDYRLGRMNSKAEKYMNERQIQGFKSKSYLMASVALGGLTAMLGWGNEIYEMAQNLPFWASGLGTLTSTGMSAYHGNQYKKENKKISSLKKRTKMEFNNQEKLNEKVKEKGLKNLEWILDE